MLNSFFNLDTLFTIVAFLGVLMVLVIAHELGHFTTARFFGVKVDEFGLGFPPRLLSFTRGETRYSINALPLGGFVKLAGEEDATIPRSLASKSARIRVTVLAAGALMNAILPLLFFSIAFMIPQTIPTGPVRISEIVANSPASQAGLKSGDIIESVNGNNLHNSADLYQAIQLHLGNETTLSIKHADGTRATVTVTPRWKPPQGQGAIGVKIETVDPVPVKESFPIWKAVPMGVQECIDTYVLFKNGIISMIVGTTPAVVAGPVGIAQITGEVARSGWSELLQFAAFLSINLAIVNILPLPALDGGRIAFVVLEKIRRKKISPRVEGLVHMIGFATLLALIALVTYQDIIRAISGQGIFP